MFRIAAALLLLCSLFAPANASTYACGYLEHWLNAATGGRYLPDAVESGPGGTAFTIDFDTATLTDRSGRPEKGIALPFSVLANNLSIYVAADGEFALYSVFPSEPDPLGNVFGTVLRIVDRAHLPKGGLMSRITCKPSPV